MKLLSGWIKSNYVMLANAISLVGTTAITSVLGFVYWWAAARGFPPAVVGVASASVSAMTLLGGLSILGLGTLLITELPRQPGLAGSLISTSLVVVGVVGGAVGLVFALVAPLVSPGFKVLGANSLYTAIFSAGVSLTAISVVLDQALVGLLRGGLQLYRNTLFAVIKLAALIAVSIVLVSGGEITIYATWAIGNVFSMLALTPWLAFKKERATRNFRPRWSVLRKLGPAALQHHLLNLTLQVPTLVLPVIVTALLSATMNAWFYVAWMITGFVFLVPNVLTIVLHAMNSAQQSSLAQRARVTLCLGLVTSLLANSLILVGARQVLSLFGSSYAIHAALILHILGLAAFPLIIKYHYIAICRIQDRIARAMLSMLPGGLLEMGTAIAGAHIGGLTGLSAGWVIAICIESLFMCRTVYTTVRAAARLAPAVATHSLAIEDIWLMNTAPLPIIGHSSMGIESSWLANTSHLPAQHSPAMGQEKREPAGSEQFRALRAQQRTSGRQFRLRPPRLQPITPFHNAARKSPATGDVPEMKNIQISPSHF